MTDTTVHIGENSPEYVAYQLLRDIALCEGVVLGHSREGNSASREWILATYTACRIATKGNLSVEAMIAVAQESSRTSG